MIDGNIKLEDQEFVELSDIIYKNSGILFSDAKRYLLENRLSRHLKSLNFSSFKDYIYYLKYDVNRREELKKLINLVTINETYFLRETAQMEHFVKKYVPQLISEGKTSCRAWSIPCSTGEEPYSIMSLMYDSGILNKIRFTLIASDINSEVVEIAKAGEYRSPSFRGVPPAFYNHFDKKDQSYVVKPYLKMNIIFNEANVMAPNLLSVVGGKLDAIFCRNMLIYFDTDGKKQVIKSFSNLLNPGGHLYVGHSESLTKISDDFQLSTAGGCIVYVKK